MRAILAVLLLFVPPALTRAATEPAELPAPRDQAWWEAQFAGWKAPVPPRRLVGNIHYVGTMGVSAFLITTREGHILLDTGFADTVPQLVESIEALGFKPSEIKLLLSSHAHVDHVAGHAEMKRRTGAQVLASAGDRRILESGGTDDYFPAPREVVRYEPVRVDRVVADGERVRLGEVTLTAQITPGHTRGATTWTTEVKEEGRTYAVVFFSSLSINDGTRLKLKPSYPEIVADFEQAFRRLKSLSCDIYFAPHPWAFGMAQKFAKMDEGAGVAALEDKDGWRALIGVAEYNFRKQLRAEEAAAKGGK